MTFDDFSLTGALYHIVSIMDLEKTLAEGIRYDDKLTYLNKYYDFHSYFDKYKTRDIPSWVERRKAIFCSMNFKETNNWHSHTALLKVKADIEKCWVCNENKANPLFEPFILQHISGFKKAKDFINKRGPLMVEEYWKTSLSLKENMKMRRDKEKSYDAEILIFQDIPPENIECLYIISDHSIMTPEKFITEPIRPKPPVPQGTFSCPCRAREGASAGGGCPRAVKYKEVACTPRGKSLR